MKGGLEGVRMAQSFPNPGHNDSPNSSLRISALPQVKVPSWSWEVELGIIPQ